MIGGDWAVWDASVAAESSMGRRCSEPANKSSGEESPPQGLLGSSSSFTLKSPGFERRLPFAPSVGLDDWGRTSPCPCINHPPTPDHHHESPGRALLPSSAVEMPATRCHQRQDQAFATGRLCCRRSLTTTVPRHPENQESGPGSELSVVWKSPASSFSRDSDGPQLSAEPF